MRRAQTAPGCEYGTALNRQRCATLGAPFSYRYTLRSVFDFLRPSLRQSVPLRFAPPSFHAQAVGQGKVFRVVFGGDIMTPFLRSVPGVAPELRRILGGADLFIGNCEGSLVIEKKAPKGIPRFHFDIEEGFLRVFLQELGLTPSRCVLSVANNHMGDRGLAGLDATLDRLRGMGVTAVGQHVEGQPPVHFLERSGLRLGIAAWTHWQNSRVFDHSVGVRRGRDVPTWDWRAIKEKRGLDGLIGIPHWGVEFRHFPRREEQKLAEDLVRAGFDVLAGHHPHVIQPLEWLGRSPCFYSLGNVNGPPIPFLPWPIRLGAFWELGLFTGGPNRGSPATWTIHFFFRQNIGGREWLLPLEGARGAERQKMEERLRLLFPFRTANQQAETEHS